MSPEEYLKKYGNPDTFPQDRKRLEQGEPVQYIVGNVDFCGNVINVNPSVLIPRFETEELVSRTIHYLKKFHLENGSLVDIGTGSGCIAITLKKELPNLEVDAVDISKEALEVAMENAKINNVEITFFHGNLLEPLKKRYSCIISNPPYIGEHEEVEEIVKNNEPSYALFAADDGFYYYEEILRNALVYLEEHYLLAFEIGMNQKERLTKIANQYFPDSRIWFEQDLSEKDRYLFIQK